MPIALVLVLGLTLESPSGDLAAIQRTVVADLIGGAATRLGSAFCVWVAPPAPSAAFLASIPAKAGITVRGGPACEPKMQGGRVRDTREPAWIIEVGRPELDGAAATVEGGASCGGECSSWYRYSLERTPDGWRVKGKEILSIS